MSRGSGSGGLSRGKSNSRRHSMNKSNKSSLDNRSNQMNPNNPDYDSSRRDSGSSGRWSRRMDERSALRIQSHADKTASNQDFKARVQSAAENNKEKNN